MPVPRTLLTSEPQDLDLDLTSGSWPADISGEMYISGPDTRARSDYALFSPGITYRLSLRPDSDGRFPWRQRRVETPSTRLWERRRDLFPPGQFGSLMSTTGMLNAGNTAPLPWGDRLFATWDVGRPSELDPATLQFLGEVGHKKHWQTMLPMQSVFPFIFSSAHPVVDPERDCLWTVCLQMAPESAPALACSIVRYGGEGTGIDVWPVANSRIPGSMHTITQTRDWLVLAESGNFKSDPAEMGGGERSVLVDLDVPVYLIRKDALDAVAPGTPVEADEFRIGPPTGHYYAAYDDTEGIRVLFEHMNDIDLGFYVRDNDLDAYGDPVDPALAGMYSMAMSPAKLSEIVFDPETGSVKDAADFSDPERIWSSQLNGLDWSLEGTTTPTLHHMVFEGWCPELVPRREVDLYESAGRIDPAKFPGEETPARLVSVRRGSLEEHAERIYALDEFPTSPIFAPRAAGSDSSKSRYSGTDPGGHDGYVVTIVHHDDGFRVELLDAGDVSNGPVAVLEPPHGETLPMLLHAAWMPTVREAVEVERLSFADELDDSELSALGAEVTSDIREIAAAPAGD